MLSFILIVSFRVDNQQFSLLNCLEKIDREMINWFSTTNYQQLKMCELCN